MSLPCAGFPSRKRAPPVDHFAPLPRTSFPSKIDHRDHYLTTTHTKAREASAEKASRAFYMVFNFVHNRRKTA